MDHSLEISAMFMLGLLGSGHCIGMCGPLVVAFPGRTGRFSANLFYHLGRIITYTLLGIILGAAGTVISGVASAAGADALSWTAGIQAAFSMIAAAALLIFGLCRLGLITEPPWIALGSPEKIPGYRQTVKSASGVITAGKMITIGLFMGLLPCGLSFAAFARSLPAGGPLQGGLMTLFFGLGTLPALLLVGAGAAGVFSKYRKVLDPLSGMLMIGMAASLIVKILVNI